jgi:hypothetical protein
MANGRSSQDERKLEGGAAPAPAPSTGLHPAFYIAYVVAGETLPLEVSVTSRNP